MAEEEATQEVPEEEEETGEQGAEPAAEVGDSKTPPAPKQPIDEMKVVIVMKADRIMLGVQAPECDPVYTTLKGGLGKALKRVPGLVAEAKQKWEATPRYPKANLPEPPPSPPPPARMSKAAKPAKPTGQPSMF